ncbi:MAG: DUF11 domain-containing protein [Ramlibacter sp.]|nr:DUF11 domain-containing protein [Ramlibacter sp.]
MKHLRARALLLAAAGWMLAFTVQAQTCAAPGKDAPGTPSGIVNTYYPGTGSPAAGATSLTLGTPASGAAGTVTVNDLLLVIQMQGASINTNDDERYGDGTGTAGNTPVTTASQANGYTALNQAGLYEYVRVTQVAGSVITFTPALTNAYVQNTGTAPRRTYQVIRVPQYPGVTVSGASTLLALGWTGLVGGVLAIDVTGVLTASGAGPHLDASTRGFRGGVHQTAPNSNIPGNYLYRSTNYNDGGSKGEGIAGTPRYVQTSIAGGYNSGTAFNNANATFIDNGATGYTNGDAMRGAPANAGGGGNSHNAAGGGGGNGGEGGSGGQTYNGDTPGLADRGGYGGSRTPQDGVLLASRVFMGGGGGSGSMNNSTPPRGSGGNGGGIVMLRAGRISGALVLRADGQRGWDDDNGNDAGGGGGAGGSIVVTAGSGHGNVTAQARGGNGANSNKTPRTGAPNQPCCDGEREGPGGGAGGGAVYSNSPLGSLALAGGANGNSAEDLYQGFSGNMLAQPGSAGVSASTISASAIAGVRPGYDCEPQLTVVKTTTTPTRTLPGQTTGNYVISIANPATGSGVAYGVSISDSLPSPFSRYATTATVAYANGASGPTSPITLGGTTATLVFGTAGSGTSGFTLPPGGNLTLTFAVNLNAAANGTYQNGATLSLTDATRLTGGAGNSALNGAVSPGGTDAAGNAVGGASYASGSSTGEDITISGSSTATSADLSLTKTGPATADVGSAVQYILLVSNAGPADVAGSVTVSDIVPANIGTVTWACSVLAGSADCDTASGGTGAVGSGTITLPRIQIASGGQLQITVDGIAASAGSITNTATVSLPAGYTDPTPGNNTGTVATVISVPSADLSVTKSDGVTTVTAGGVTVYTIVAANAGPSAAANATVTDPVATGLAKLSISCSAQGGASCPVGLTTATFQAGTQIPVFPAGSTVTFVLNAQVTATTGTVTNSVSITAPAGVTEINTANNSALDTSRVAASTAAISSGAGICPAGTTESIVNLLVNSDFADTSSSVGSGVTQYPVNTNLPDTSVGPQTGAQTYGTVTQRPFPGDPARSVATAANWLYSNGNNTGAAFRLWSQAVTGLVAGRTYEWLYYGSNAQNPGSAVANPPQIQFRVVAGTTTFTLGGTDGYANEGSGTSDTWTLRQRSFGATTTGVTLQLWDTQTAGGGTGDTFGATQILLRECTPDADPFITKSNGTSTVQTLTTTSYVLTVGNNGPGPADGIVITDPAAAGLSKTALACAASGAGAQCPLSLSLAALEGGGLTVPALPANTTLVLTVTASVTALNGTVTNTASIGLPAGMNDSNTANNTAVDADAVRGSVLLTVAKSNGLGTVTSGATTSYTVTVANNGPSSADGAVLMDPVATGLSCVTAAPCTASGGASCGVASVPAATVQGGFTIPVLPAGGSVTLQLTCSVTATGQ